jgi:hypothetical protein
VASFSQGRTAAAQCRLFTHKSVSVIFERPCNILLLSTNTVVVTRVAVGVGVEWSHRYLPPTATDILQSEMHLGEVQLCLMRAGYPFGPRNGYLNSSTSFM